MSCAFLCCYDACDCTNPLLFGKGGMDCLCLRHSCCLALNTPDKGCGCTTDENRGECCKIGCFCCDLGLAWPTSICACASQCLCYYTVAGFPCSDEFVPEPVCTICCPCLQVCPRCGCCMAPPPCPAFDKILRDEPLPLVQNMERGTPMAAVAASNAVAPQEIQEKTVNPDGTVTTVTTRTVTHPDGSKTATETTAISQLRLKAAVVNQ